MQECDNVILGNDNLTCRGGDVGCICCIDINYLLPNFIEFF